MINRHSEQRETGNDYKTVIMLNGKEIMRAYREHLVIGDRVVSQFKGFIVDAISITGDEQRVSVRVEG